MVWCHYVPQFYMRGFGISDKQVIRYDKKTGRVITASIESFCAQDDFFCFDDKDLDGLPFALSQFDPPSEVTVPPHLEVINKRWLEDALGYYFEGVTNEVINKIRCEKNLKNVSEDELIGFLGWLCWIFIANPSSLAMESIKNTVGRSITTEKFFSSGERLEFYFNLRDRLEPYFIHRKWMLQVIDQSEGPLLSSDRPVMLGGLSLSDPPHLENHTILFPISPELLLIGVKNNEWGSVHLPLKSRKEASALATVLTVDQANRFVFGNSMQALESLFKDLKNSYETFKTDQG